MMPWLMVHVDYKVTFFSYCIHAIQVGVRGEINITFCHTLLIDLATSLIDFIIMLIRLKNIYHTTLIV